MTVAAVAREVGVYQRRMVHRRLGRLPEKHSNTQQEIAKKKPDARPLRQRRQHLWTHPGSWTRWGR